MCDVVQKCLICFTGEEAFMWMLEKQTHVSLLHVISFCLISSQQGGKD